MGVMPGPAQNTDRELFREPPEPGTFGMEAYAPKVFVTAQGAIGMQVGGLAIVMPIAKWHAAAIHARGCSAEVDDRPSVSAWPYEPGELAQPGTYGPETFDRG
jgi:hypothetical protein